MWTPTLADEELCFLIDEDGWLMITLNCNSFIHVGESFVFIKVLVNQIHGIYDNYLKLAAYPGFARVVKQPVP